MTLFNDLSEGGCAGRGSDSGPPSGVFVNRKRYHEKERLPGSVSAAAGGGALRAKQLLLT